MLSGPNRVTNFHRSIFAIVGYYTDYDHLQHVVAAETNGDVYEVHWDPVTFAAYHLRATHEGADR